MTTKELAKMLVSRATCPRVIKKAAERYTKTSTPESFVQHFNVGGTEYHAKANKRPGYDQSWGVAFANKTPSAGGTVHWFDQTGHQGHQAIHVMRTMGDFLNDFITTKQPQKFDFSASHDEPSRVSLYRKYAERLAKTHGYNLKVTEPTSFAGPHDDAWYFHFEKPSESAVNLARRVMGRVRLEKRKIVTPEEREHNEALAELQAGTSDLLGAISRLKPGTHHEANGQHYLSTIDGPKVLKTIPLSQITNRPQSYRNESIVSGYEAKYRDPSIRVEPVVLDPEESGYFLRDGHHRVDAAERAGKSHIEAWVPMNASPVTPSRVTPERLARRVLDRVRLARRLPTAVKKPQDREHPLTPEEQQEWDALANKWLGESHLTQDHLGILSDWLEDHGMVQKANTLRSRDQFARHFNNWNYEERIPAKDQTEEWAARFMLRPARERASARDNHLHAVHREAAILFSPEGSNLGDSKSSAFKEFITGLPNHKTPTPDVKVRGRPKLVVEKPQQLARAVMNRVKLANPKKQPKSMMGTVPMPDWLAQNLRPHEAADLTGLRAKALPDNPVNMPAHVAGAVAGRANKDWYRAKSELDREAVRHLAEPNAFERFVLTFAGTSPNAGVPDNLRNQLDIQRLRMIGVRLPGGREIPAGTTDPNEIKAVHEGLNFGKVFYGKNYPDPALRGKPVVRTVKTEKGESQRQIHQPGVGWVNTGMRNPVHPNLIAKALKHPGGLHPVDLPGRLHVGKGEHALKADSFYRNFLGDTQASTNDRHEGRLWGFNETDLSKPGPYHAITAGNRYIGRLVGQMSGHVLHPDSPYHGAWSASEVQAGKWAVSRILSRRLRSGQSPAEAVNGITGADIYNGAGWEGVYNHPNVQARIKTMIGEGVLPPNYQSRLQKILLKYRPPEHELAAVVGDINLLPLAQQIYNLEAKKPYKVRALLTQFRKKGMLETPPKKTQRIPTPSMFTGQ